MPRAPLPGGCACCVHADRIVCVGMCACRVQGCGLGVVCMCVYCVCACVCCVRVVYMCVVRVVCTCVLCVVCVLCVYVCVVCMCVLCLCMCVCVVCVDVCVVCTLISVPSAPSCRFRPDPRAMRKGHGGKARASEQLGVKEDRDGQVRAQPAGAQWCEWRQGPGLGAMHGQPRIRCKHSQEAPSSPRDLQESGPNPEPRARLWTQNESDPCLRPRETLTQAWPPWLPFPAPHGLLLNPQNLTRLLSSTPWRTSVPAPCSRHRQDHVICCPLCAHWTGQEQGQSESCWGSQSLEQSPGLGVMAARPPAHR